MTKEKYTYEQRVVAYLDILATKDLIKKQDSRMFHVMSIFADYKSRHRDNLEISIFSDNIAISFRLSEDNQDNLKNIRFLILEITLRLCAYLFLEGILLRGSITSGELYHKNNQIIGQALIDAYEMESKLAFYPRIILGQKIEELINKNDTPAIKDIIVSDGKRIGTQKITQSYSSTLPIKLSDDGYSYLDWLPWCIDELVIEEETFKDIPIGNYQPNFQFIEKMKQTIEVNLAESKEHPSVWSKWRWVAIYFNNSMTERNLMTYQIDIRSIKNYE